MEIQDNSSLCLEFNNYLEFIIHILKDLIRSHYGANEFEVQRIDSNAYVIFVKIAENQVFKIRIFQLLQTVKILAYDLEKTRFYDFAISLPKFFKPFIRNTIKITPERPITDYFLKARYQVFENLLKCRTLNNVFGVQKESHSFDKLSQPDMVNMTKFLRRKDIFNLMTCNAGIYKKYFLDNGFWMIVYNNHFKKSGFASSQVNWRSAFFDKKK